MCDDKGTLIDGDQLMAMIATYWHKKERRLKAVAWWQPTCPTLPSSVTLAAMGLKLHRAKNR